MRVSTAIPFGSQLERPSRIDLLKNGLRRHRRRDRAPWRNDQ
jgi:hypothetical protein